MCNFLNFSNDACTHMAINAHVNTLDQCTGYFDTFSSNSERTHNSSKALQLRSGSEAFLCWLSVMLDRIVTEMLIKMSLLFE